jgi:hypothetical protein
MCVSFLFLWFLQVKKKKGQKETREKKTASKNKNKK